MKSVRLIGRTSTTLKQTRISKQQLQRTPINQLINQSHNLQFTRSFATNVDEAVDDDEPDVAFPAFEFARADLKPSALVAELDRYIVGQADAKRALSVALRNRWRRHSLTAEMKNEVTPRNILMVGPTGCGKTEIARRLAKITDSPFIKVEATKFTEVGFYGQDVDSIIKNLAKVTVPLMKARRRDRYKERVMPAVEEILVDAIMVTLNESSKDKTETLTRQQHMVKLRAGEYEDVEVEIDVPASPQGEKEGGQGGALIVQFLAVSSPRMMSGSSPKTMPVRDARPILVDTELSKAMNNEDLSALARKAIEEDGIVFIDEIDKICTSSDSIRRSHADASAEGVQRDLLPLIEGSSVSTPIGIIDTSHILFVCSGAFHSCSPKDLLPELQGRLPVRVELKALTEEDMYKILTVPVSNLIIQQIELLKTDGIELEFKDDAIREIARVAVEVNRAVENIGARRLNTIIAQIVDDISFQAADLDIGTKIVIDKDTVVNKVAPLLKSADLTRYLL